MPLIWCKCICMYCPNLLRNRLCLQAISITQWPNVKETLLPSCANDTQFRWEVDVILVLDAHIEPHSLSSLQTVLVTQSGLLRYCRCAPLNPFDEVPHDRAFREVMGNHTTSTMLLLRTDCGPANDKKNMSKYRRIQEPAP